MEKLFNWLHVLEVRDVEWYFDIIIAKYQIYVKYQMK